MDGFANTGSLLDWKPSCEGEMLLVADVHRAQNTKAIIKLLQERCNTEIEFVPPGATSLVQPMDVVFNAPFKAAVDKLATDHLPSNVEAYLRGEINASQRCILLTKWIGQAWEVSSNKMVQHSFKKCGIAVAIDGSEDEQINIEGLDGYSVEDEGDATDDDDDDPFKDLDD